MSPDDAALLKAAQSYIPGPNDDPPAEGVDYSLKRPLLTLLGGVSFLGVAYLVIEWFNT